MKIFRTIIANVLALLTLSCAANQHSISINDYFERRESCEHFRGEFPDPPDPVRVKEVIDGVKEFCTGTDAELAALKLQYADNPAILERLNAYEPRIERKKRP